LAVYRELGCGFLECVYQEALAIELGIRDIPCQREVELPISYRGRRLNATYRADFLCYDTVIVELKALKRLSGAEISQVNNYLRAAGLQTGLLLNFGTPLLERKRFVHSGGSKGSRPRSSRQRVNQSAKSADATRSGGPRWD